MPVSTEQVGIEVGHAPNPGEVEQWQQWIADALLLIEQRAKGVGRTLADLEPALVDYVVRLAVAEHVRNPESASQVAQTISIDDGSSTSTRTFATSPGRVRITADWWKLLGLVAVSTGAFSIDTAPVGALLGGHALYCSLRLGGAYCSCGAELTGGAYPLWEWAGG